MNLQLFLATEIPVPATCLELSWMKREVGRIFKLNSAPISAMVSSECRRFGFSKGVLE